MTGYLNFDLHVTRTESGYKARVFDSPVGQASNDFILLPSILDIAAFYRHVEILRSSPTTAASSFEYIKNYGNALYQTLLDKKTGVCFRRSLDEAGRQGMGLRIRLRLSDVPEISTIPWEYLYDREYNRFLSLSGQTPIIRYLDVGEPVKPFHVNTPLKILVVVSEPIDLPKLEAEDEWNNLQKALADLERHGLVQLVRLQDASLALFQRALRTEAFHIFHFIGHGNYNENTQEGVLAFESDDKQSHFISDRQLGMLLYDASTLRFVFLNACEGASTSNTNAFAGIAQNLVRQGIPAVLAMQYNITDTAASILSSSFYSALADGFPIDAALAEARKTIEIANLKGIEWGIPALYSRVSDGRIFEKETQRVVHTEGGSGTRQPLSSNSKSASQLVADTDVNNVDVSSVPLLLRAIEFLFGEGSTILAERRERRDAEYGASIQSSANQTQKIDSTGEKIRSKTDAIGQVISESDWTNAQIEVNQLMKLLDIHKKTYYRAKEQYAKWGSALVPPIIENTVNEAEDEILKTSQKLQIVLTRVFRKNVNVSEVDQS